MNTVVAIQNQSFFTLFSLPAAVDPKRKQNISLLSPLADRAEVQNQRPSWAPGLVLAWLLEFRMKINVIPECTNSKGRDFYKLYQSFQFWKKLNYSFWTLKSEEDWLQYNVINFWD